MNFSQLLLSVCKHKGTHSSRQGALKRILPKSGLSIYSLFWQLVQKESPEMIAKFVLTLSAILPLMLYCKKSASISRSYRIPDLLEPQVRLHVALCVPEFYSHAFVRHGSQPFDQALQFLVSQRVPFYLFVNETKPQSPGTANRQSRHGDNQVPIS